MIKKTKIEVWMTDNPGEGEELIKSEDVAKIVEEMKTKLLGLNDRIVIIGTTTSEEVSNHMQPYHEENSEKKGDTQKHIPREGYDVNGKDVKKISDPLTDLICYNCGAYLTMKTLRDFYCRGCHAKYRIDNDGVFYRV